MHQIEFYNELSEDLILEEELTEFVGASLAEIQPSFEVLVTVTVTDSDTICRVNREQRGIDRPTDVLSFPMLFYSEPEVLAEPLGDYDYDPDTNKVILGDILLCKEKIMEQAEEYGHSFRREIYYLTLHGLLHLFGYDHMTDSDKVLMRAKEKEILAALGEQFY